MLYWFKMIISIINVKAKLAAIKKLGVNHLSTCIFFQQCFRTIPLKVFPPSHTVTRTKLLYKHCRHYFSNKSSVSTQAQTKSMILNRIKHVSLSIPYNVLVDTVYLKIYKQKIQYNSYFYVFVSTYCRVIRLSVVCWYRFVVFFLLILLFFFFSFFKQLYAFYILTMDFWNKHGWTDGWIYTLLPIKVDRIDRAFDRKRHYEHKIYCTSHAVYNM